MERYHYRGELAERPLPEMLNTIERFGVPGVLEAINDDVVKRLYVGDGEIVHATSSQREDSLEAHLVRTELVVAAVLKRLQRSYRGKAPLGTLLLEHDLLSAAELAQAQRDQVEGIVWSLFRWSRGSVTFSIGEQQELPDEALSIPIRYAIKEGARYYPLPNELLELLGPTSKVEKQYEPIDLIDLGLREEEISLLKGIEDGVSLEEVCSSSPLGLEDGVRLLYGFSVLQLVNIEPTEEHLASLRSASLAGAAVAGGPLAGASLPGPPPAAADEAARGEGDGGEPSEDVQSTGLRIRLKTDGDRFSE